LINSIVRDVQGVEAGENALDTSTVACNFRKRARNGEFADKTSPNGGGEFIREACAIRKSWQARKVAREPWAIHESAPANNYRSASRIENEDRRNRLDVRALLEREGGVCSKLHSVAKLKAEERL
jgi:hypothetical protein